MKLDRKKQIILLNTSDDDLLKVFPDYTRDELRAYKNELKDGSVIVKEQRDKHYLKSLEKEVEKLRKEIDQKDAELDVFNTFSTFQPDYQIKSTKNGGKLSATSFIVFSDWHVDEYVKAKTVNNLNEFNPDIADFRINCAFNNAIRLIKIAEKDVHIDKIVICLLGDFISGTIAHEQQMENASMLVKDAILWTTDRLYAGLKMFRENFDNILVVCNSGNHGRQTKKIHHSTFEENSIEGIMYGFLKRSLPEIDFQIAEGYHSYITCYERNIRLSHGHNLKFFGGIGNIFPSAYKSISQWNKSKVAALDIWGHFHSSKNGGIFIQNGSLIGWNAYANSIKADFERPTQRFFLYLSNGMVSMDSPILLEKI